MQIRHLANSKASIQEGKGNIAPAGEVEAVFTFHSGCWGETEVEGMIRIYSHQLKRGSVVVEWTEGA